MQVWRVAGPGFKASGVGGAAGAAGTWSTPRGRSLAHSGLCPQLLRREGRVAQLREPGPARGLQSPGAGRLPAQRGGERASLRPHEPARTGISSHQGTT